MSNDHLPAEPMFDIVDTVEMLVVECTYVPESDVYTVPAWMMDRLRMAHRNITGRSIKVASP